MATKKPAAPFDYDLVVIHQFGDRVRGTRVTDPDEIEEIRNGENLHHCHKVAKQAQ
jgi:hypothetical protein